MNAYTIVRFDFSVLLSFLEVFSQVVNSTSLDLVEDTPNSPLIFLREASKPITRQWCFNALVILLVWFDQQLEAQFGSSPKL
jgi:hypothetical protein